MRKVYFRADASSQIGYGHFIRSLALADMLKDDYECVFFTQQPTEFQINELKNICPVISLPANDSKYELFLDYLEGNEIVVLDNYFFTSEYERLLKRKGCKIVSLGSNNRHYYADAVVNFTNLKPSDFSTEPYTQLCLGLHWAILRPPFREPIVYGKREKGSAVVSFGGTDQFCLTEKVLDQIGSNNVSVLCTSKVPIERLCGFKRKGAKVFVDVAADTVANLFETAEWAILSSSTICLEALSRGAKVIAGHYIENQINFYNVLLNQKAIIGVGDLMKDCSYRFIRKILQNDSQAECLNIDFSKQKENYLHLFKSLC